MLLSLLLLHLLGSGVLGLGGRYRQATDDCIRNGMVMTNESVIHEGLLSNRTCAFLMSGNPHIVLQPLKLNLNESVVIKLYSITRQGSDISKNLVTKYYGRYMYNNLIFMARTNDEFALVVLTRGNGTIGNFSFVFRTYCFAEVIMENYPTFSSPNYGYGSGIFSNELCQYDVFSIKGEPYSIKFGNVFSIPYYYGLGYDNYTINGVPQIINSYQSFNATNKTQIVYLSVQNYYYYYYNYRGFNATVQPLVSNMRLKHFGRKNMTGDMQIKFDKDWYYIQMFPAAPSYFYMSLVSVFYSYLNPINYNYYYNDYYYYYLFDGNNWKYGYAVTDAHVMCRDFGYATVERIDSHTVVATEDRVMAHGFMCRGDERKLSQCATVIPNDLQYLSSYSSPQNVLKLTCADQFQFRLTNGDYGYAQVLLFGIWSMIFSDNMDTAAAEILCQEMGFAGVRSVINNTYSYYYWGSNFKLSNIRCGSSTRFKDCSYILGSVYYYGYSPLWLSCISKDQLSLIGGAYENGGYIRRNKTLACLDNFDQSTAAQVCQDMGYPGVISPTFTSYSFNVSEYSIRPLSCSDTPSNGSKCAFNLEESCPSGKPAGVICQNVALAGTNKSGEGRVEVYYGGRKGLLCDDSFNSSDGDVICRQLGFENTLATYQRAGERYGYGNGIYLLRSLNCTGTESTINHCKSLGWLTNDCGGNEVVGLVCNKALQGCGQRFVWDTVNGSTNGYQTVANAYPWHVHLYPSSFTEEWCSGTILNKYWVLTSASCIIKSNVVYNLEVGKHHIHNLDKKYEVKSFFIHPDYSAVTEDNNIALVKISSSSSSFVYDNTVQPACLPPMNQTIQDLTCVTTGWRHLQDDNNKYLMAKPIKIQDFSYCTEKTGFDSQRMDRFLCSDNNLGTSAVFNGESGGPLTCSYNGKNTVVGIMARSILGARATKTILFTKVEYYTSWIATTMESNA